MDEASEGALYPPIEPFDSGYVQVSALHRIYYEQVGNPAGTPALFLHGGPGGGVEPIHRQFFDPEHYRVILFDQRGSGKSLPSAELKENTTWHLVEDIIRLRQHLGISGKMLVFGGSWGSALALAFAVTHPELVLALVLRGIFTLRHRELAWFYEGHGADRVFPEAWQDFIAPIPPSERVAAKTADIERLDSEHAARLPLIHAYYQRLISSDQAERMQAARAWSIWEGRTSYLRATVDAENKYGKPEFAEAFARIECHYFVHGGFFERDGWLLEPSQCSRIRDLPCTIVQGRYDMVCPFETAWLLKNQLPEAIFIIVEDAGHSAMEPGTQRHLVMATDRYRALSDRAI
jgi:proline iminopeptidase